MEELLLADNPACAHGPDRLVLVFRACAPQVGAVPAEAAGDAVEVVVGVGRIAVDGDVAVYVLVGGGDLVRVIKLVPSQQSVHAFEQGCVVYLCRGQHLGVVVVELVAVILLLVLDGFGTHDGGHAVYVVEGLAEIQLLTEVVGRGVLVRAGEDVSIGNDILRSAPTVILGKAVDCFAHTGGLFLLQSFAAVRAALILERGGILQAGKELDVQSRIGTQRQLLGGSDLTVQLLQGSDVHAIEPIRVVDGQVVGAVALLHWFGIVRPVRVPKVIVGHE